MAGLYAADGSWNVTVVTGLDRVDYYALDGSVNVTGSTGTGAMHPCGCLAVTSTPDDTEFWGRYAPDGSLYVSSTFPNTGCQRVTFVSGSL